MPKETTCKHCGEVFPSKGKYEYHYRIEHHTAPHGATASRYGAISPSRGSQERENPTRFSCICGKGYTAPFSLDRHKKACQQWQEEEAHQLRDSGNPGDRNVTGPGKKQAKMLLANIR